MILNPSHAHKFNYGLGIYSCQNLTLHDRPIPTSLEWKLHKSYRHPDKHINIYI